MSKRIGFIINAAAAAGRSSARWAAMQECFRQDGVQGRTLFTSRPGDAVRLAQELGWECDVVVAVGGDGTIFEVASGLLLDGPARAILGVVPLGTGNDAARQFGVPDTTRARLALQGAKTINVDAIRIGCQAQGATISRHALLFAGVGILSEVLVQTTPRVKRVFGRRLAYPVGALRALVSYVAPPMRVTCDGQTRENRFLLVCASNCELSGGGMRLAAGAKLDDGFLDVNACETLGRFSAASLLWTIWRGRRPAHHQLRYFPARTVAVEASPPIPVAADGEIIGQTPAQFEVVPQALRVLVP